MRLASGNWLRPSAWRVKTKLVVTALIPLLLLMPVVASLLYSAGESAYSKILISKVRSDLVIATQVFERLQFGKLEALRAWADSEKFRRLLVQAEKKAERSPPSSVGKQTAMPNGSVPHNPVVKAENYIVEPETLGAMVEQLDLTYLRLIGIDGRVLSAYPLNGESVQLSADELEIIRSREGKAQVVLLRPEVIASISPVLTKTAELPIVPTDNASPDSRQLESRGMAVQAITPVYSQGVQVGWFDAGVLLNRNFDLVDNLSRLIYPKGALLEGSRGSATIFLEDVRIATTIEISTNERALGTRVSDEVRQSVMGRGEVWLERAFVVNNWYIAGYAPLTSADGSRIGMLYVGFLEAPYAALKMQLLTLFLIAVAVAMGLGAYLVNKVSLVIFKPLGKMNAVMTAQEAGNTSARVGAMRRRDEFSELSAHFDSLLDQLAHRQADLLVANTELDARVGQRTAALHEANLKLRDAIEQLLASEKLAVMGQLTAGVAHEFNNPLAIMMGHLDLLKLDLQGKVDCSSLAMLDEQVQRMQRIVQKLLQFCRPDEFASYTQAVDVGQVITDSLLFVNKELISSQCVVTRQDEATRLVQISATELQQIMVNLLINASHALELAPVGVGPQWTAQLRISTHDIEIEHGRHAVRISVENNGQAINDSDQLKIFKMFYTTKREGKGSGIGLPVSKMLIQRYGGDLTVKSAIYENPVPHGVRFDVTILCQAKPTAELLRESQDSVGLLPANVSF